MRPLKQTVYRQLFTIAFIIIGIIAIFLGVLLPKMLLPVYEKSIYEYLIVIFVGERRGKLLFSLQMTVHHWGKSSQELKAGIWRQELI